MGGKKKNLANRLAKMSDEERARYLQRKADMEEEAKRRKEQLVSTFMKNKIKREDAFSRLNLAKINQHWHQILRTAKVKSMKEDVEHMKQYVTRTVECKNRTINLLLEELEMAEMQYSHNFQTHSLHIDEIIKSHNKHLQRLHQRYEDDKNELITAMSQEQEGIKGNAEAEQTHLKTINFAQASKASGKYIKSQDSYMEKKQDLISSYEIKLSEMVKNHGHISSALWRQIASIIRSHVHQTDARRLHLAELKRIDAESAAKIAEDQERINAEQDEIASLNSHLSSVETKRTKHIEYLQKKLREDHKNFSVIRNTFRKDNENDEKKLIILSETSNSSIRYLEKLYEKGVHIINLMKACQKLETDREKIEKWLPIELFSCEIDEEETDTEIKRQPTEKKSYSGDILKKIIISSKSAPTSRSRSTPFEGKTEVIDSIKEQIDSIMDMEKFWFVYNKAESELNELREERKALVEENKKLKGIIKCALEAAILEEKTGTSAVLAAVKSAPRLRKLKTAAF